MHKTGCFGSASKLWHNKSSTDKTWINLKTHFKASDQDQRLNGTSEDAGYTSVTNANQTNQFKDKHNQQANEWDKATTVSDTAASLTSLA